MGEIGRDIVERVIGVYEAPILGWGTVVQERIVFLSSFGVEVEPLAFAAVKVLRQTQYSILTFNVLQWVRFPYPIVIVSEQRFVSHGYRP